MKIEQPLRILVDRREQRPWTFDDLDVETIPATLQSGDYVVPGAPGFAIERKAPGDLLGCLGGGRERFLAELVRLESECTTAAVVCECSLPELLDGRHRSRINPSSVVGTLSAWSLRMPSISWWFCPSRSWAERFGYRLLSRWAQDRADAERFEAECELQTEPVRVARGRQHRKRRTATVSGR